MEVNLGLVDKSLLKQSLELTNGGSLDDDLKSNVGGLFGFKKVQEQIKKQIEEQKKAEELRAKNAADKAKAEAEAKAKEEAELKAKAEADAKGGSVDLSKISTSTTTTTTNTTTTDPNVRTMNPDLSGATTGDAVGSGEKLAAPKKFLGMPRTIGITVAVVGGLALIVGGILIVRKMRKK